MQGGYGMIRLEGVYYTASFEEQGVLLKPNIEARSRIGLRGFLIIKMLREYPTVYQNVSSGMETGYDTCRIL